MENKSDLNRGQVLRKLLVNNVMKGGKKFKAQKIVDGIFKDNKEIIQCIDKLKVSVYTKKRVIAGAARQIPHEIGQTKQDSLAVKWFVKAMREYIKKGTNAIKAGKNLHIETMEDRGGAITLKKAAMQLAKDNRALVGFRW